MLLSLVVDLEAAKRGPVFFYLEMACNGMFGNDPSGGIKAPQEDRTFPVRHSSLCLISDAPRPGSHGAEESRAHVRVQIVTARLVLPNLKARQLYQDMLVIEGMAKNLPEESDRGQKAMFAGNEIVNTFWPTDPSSIDRCRTPLTRNACLRLARNACLTLAHLMLWAPPLARHHAVALAAKFLGTPASDAEHQLHVVGHCHIDTAWLWPYRCVQSGRGCTARPGADRRAHRGQHRETRRKVGRSWATQLRLMETDPEYTFACSQAVQYQWCVCRFAPSQKLAHVKTSPLPDPPSALASALFICRTRLLEDYPSVFAQVKERVKEGRFIPMGGTWVEMVRRPCAQPHASQPAGSCSEFCFAKWCRIATCLAASRSCGSSCTGSASLSSTLASAAGTPLCACTALLFVSPRVPLST